MNDSKSEILNIDKDNDYYIQEYNNEEYNLNNNELKAVDCPSYNFVLFGKTTSGKTTFIETLKRI